MREGASCDPRGRVLSPRMAVFKNLRSRSPRKGTRASLADLRMNDIEDVLDAVGPRLRAVRCKPQHHFADPAETTASASR